MSPVFDLNISLLPYVTEEEFLYIGDKLFEYAPKLGEDFTRIGQMGMNTVIRDRVKDMKDFSFTFRGDDVFTPERVKVIENIVRRQAEAILSNPAVKPAYNHKKMIANLFKRLYNELNLTKGGEKYETIRSSDG